MKILIATDGSEFSDAAIKKACELITKPNETTIQVISVYEPPAPTALGPFVASPDYQQAIVDGIKRLAEGYIEKARTTIEELFPNMSIRTAVVMGNPAQTIVEIGEEWKPDLIVIGSHGRGFWGRALLGSVSNAVVNHARCSVLVVRISRSTGEETAGVKEGSDDH